MDRLKNSFETYKNFWILGIAVVVVAALALGTAYVRSYRADKSSKGEEQVVLEACKPGDAFDINTGEPCPVVEIAAQAPAATPAPTGPTIIVDELCRADKDVLTVAGGTRVVFRNNGTAAVTMKFGAREVNLRPLRYFTAVVPATGEHDLYCGTAKVATIKTS